jgi:hypothetical protein
MLLDEKNSGFRVGFVHAGEKWGWCRRVVVCATTAVASGQWVLIDWCHAASRSRAGIELESW